MLKFETRTYKNNVLVGVGISCESFDTFEKADSAAKDNTFACGDVMVISSVVPSNAYIWKNGKCIPMIAKEGSRL